MRPCFILMAAARWFRASRNRAPHTQSANDGREDEDADDDDDDGAGDDLVGILFWWW